ncbi:unnamed protein product [Ectocarpus sp. CCAP 1310/34]|nr:unnamed protein product [Ectocarpus sp. CCAP 1310/34]
MAIREGPWQSKNDYEFILRSLRGGRRVDGRELGDMRLLRMVFARAEGQASAEIQLGRTRVLGVVTGEVVPPFPDRPMEGFLHFNVELGPMAAASMGEQRNSPLSVEIARVIEIGVRDSQALDTEALCIIGGEKLRCDVHILDHGGNLIDACTLATMAALRHFRRPEVTVDGSKVVVHHTDDKEPHPLALHHVPICVTFAIFEVTLRYCYSDFGPIMGGKDTGDPSIGRPAVGGGGASKSTGGMNGAGMSSSATQHIAADPTEAEEEVMKGRITFAMTAHKEVVEDVWKGLDIDEDETLETEGLQGFKEKSRLRGTSPSAAGAAAGPGPVPGMVQGKIPATLPGTRSTPFVVGQAPMPVAPESLKVKHLDYDDLHVTQGIREEGLRGGGNRGGRGLDINDARDTDLFAKMAAAAKLTEARVNAEEGSRDPKGRATTAGRASSKSAVTIQEGRYGTDSAAAGVGAERKPRRSTRQGGGEGHAEEDAKSEFARMAQTLRQQSGTKGVGRKQPAAMDVDSDDEEEETVTLEGEFKSAEEVPRASTGSGGVADKDGPKDMDNDDDDDNDDLLSAVKKGKGRGRGKGKAKGKRGKA